MESEDGLGLGVDGLYRVFARCVSMCKCGRWWRTGLEVNLAYIFLGSFVGAANQLSH